MHHAGREETFLVDPGAGEEGEGLWVWVPVDMPDSGTGVKRKWAERDGC